MAFKLFCWFSLHQRFFTVSFFLGGEREGIEKAFIVSSASIGATDIIWQYFVVVCDNQPVAATKKTWFEISFIGNRMVQLSEK